MKPIEKVQKATPVTQNHTNHVWESQSNKTNSQVCKICGKVAAGYNARFNELLAYHLAA